MKLHPFPCSNRITTCFGLLVWLATLQCSAMRAGDGMDVGSRKQLFIDHKFIQSSEGVSLVMNPPVRTGEVIIDADAPWEKNLQLASYSNVIAEQGVVRIWYSIVGNKHEPKQNPEFMGLAYAESKDGIHFQKPILNLVEFEGSKANNLVMPSDPKLMSIGGGAVMRDDNPACPPEERYKSWMKIYPKKGVATPGGSRIWFSPDGLRWTLSERPVTGLRATDTQATWFWDPRVGRYVGYAREWVQFAGENQIRMASYNESDDMHHWEKMHVALEPDEADAAVKMRPVVSLDRMKMDHRERLKDHSYFAKPEEEAEGLADPAPPPGAPADIYGPGVFRYEEADDVYVSFAAMFYHWNLLSASSVPDTADVRLALSRDGRHFLKPGGRKPFLGVGPAGAFDSRWLWPLPGVVKRGDELWVYYFGSNMDHSWGVDPASPRLLNVISRAVMRLDGFISADFDYSGGTIITPPIRFEGSRLELNLDTGAGGVGRVAILDASGAPIKGFTLADSDPLNGNNVRMPVSWGGKTDLSSLSGQTIRLHLRMRSTKLYAFQFR